MAARFDEGEPLDFGDSAVKEALTQTKRTQERRAKAKLHKAWTEAHLEKAKREAAMEAAARLALETLLYTRISEHALKPEETQHSDAATPTAAWSCRTRSSSLRTSRF